MNKVNIIKHPFDENRVNEYSIAKLKDIDPNVFNCCDKHRMYIEIISNNKTKNLKSFKLFIHYFKLKI